MLVATLPQNQIKDMLDRRGLSIYWLAKEVKMTYQAIHSLVTSPQIPDGTSYGTLKRIADVLDVKIDDLERPGD